MAPSRSLSTFYKLIILSHNHDVTQNLSSITIFRNRFQIWALNNNVSIRKVLKQIYFAIQLYILIICEDSNILERANGINSKHNGLMIQQCACTMVNVMEKTIVLSNHLHGTYLYHQMIDVPQLHTTAEYMYYNTHI